MLREIFQAMLFFTQHSQSSHVDLWTGRTMDCAPHTTEK
jgi:hypothetical protein